METQDFPRGGGYRFLAPSPKDLIGMDGGIGGREYRWTGEKRSGGGGIKGGHIPRGVRRGGGIVNEC